MTPPAATAAARARGGTPAAHPLAPAPLRLPPAPRRVSGHNRHPRAAAGRPQASSSPFLRLIDHPWLDRLIRGRAWIAIVAIALLGIVAMQVALLRLGAQIGSDTSIVNTMTQQNETAQAAIGKLEASGRVSSQATSLGMIYPPPAAVTYLGASAGDAGTAIHAMVAPLAAAIAAAAARPPASAVPASTPAYATPPSTPVTATAPATTTPATTTPATTTPATTTPATTTPATTTPAGTAPAGTSTPAITTPATPTPAGTAPAGTSTPPITTPVTTTPATTTPAATAPTASQAVGTPTTPATNAPKGAGSPPSVAGGAKGP